MFAFGVILYEMLAGGRPFERDSPAEVAAAIIKEEPPDLNETGRAIAPALNKIVRRCLEKNPERRFQSASDLCFALDLLSTTSGAVSEPRIALMPPGQPAALRRGRWRLPAVALLTSLLGAAIGGTLVWKATTTVLRTPQPTARFVLPLPATAGVDGGLDVSPDSGTRECDDHLAYPSIAPRVARVEQASCLEPCATNVSGLRSGRVFTRHAQHVVVELRTEEKRRFHELVEFGSNGRHVPRPFGFEQETQRADHFQPDLLGHSSCGTLVNENCVGADFDRESDRLALAISKASSRYG